MPNVSSLVLNDGVADQTFNPNKVENNVASYWDLSGGIADVAPKATLSGRGNSVAHSVKGKVTLPLTTTDEGGRTIVAENIICDFSIRLPYTSTSAERDKAYALFKSLLAHADVDSSIDNFDGFY